MTRNDAEHRPSVETKFGVLNYLNRVIAYLHALVGIRVLNGPNYFCGLAEGLVAGFAGDASVSGSGAGGVKFGIPCGIGCCSGGFT